MHHKIVPIVPSAFAAGGMDVWGAIFPCHVLPYEKLRSTSKVNEQKRWSVLTAKLGKFYLAAVSCEWNIIRQAGVIVTMTLTTAQQWGSGFEIRTAKSHYRMEPEVLDTIC